MVRAKKPATRPLPEVALTIVAACAACEECERQRLRAREPARPRPTQGERGSVLVEMVPGPDGLAWYLCVPHWFEGLHPNDLRTLGSGRVLEGT